MAEESKQTDLSTKKLPIRPILKKGYNQMVQSLMSLKVDN